MRLPYPTLAIRALEPNPTEELEIDFYNLRLVTREEMTKLAAMRRGELKVSVRILCVEAL